MTPYPPPTIPWAADDLTVAWACRQRTARGTRFGALTREQLERYYAASGWTAAGASSTVAADRERACLVLLAPGALGIRDGLVRKWTTWNELS